MGLLKVKTLRSELTKIFEVAGNLKKGKDAELKKCHQLGATINDTMRKIRVSILLISYLNAFPVHPLYGRAMVHNFPLVYRRPLPLHPNCQ